MGKSNIIKQINTLYNLLNHYSLKPEHGGAVNSTPEKRASIQNNINKLEASL